jgi:hypothetical protein
MNLLDWYERILSVVVRRFIALAFIGVGGLISLLNLWFVVPGATIELHGEPTSDIVTRIFSVILPALVAAFGVFLFRLEKLPFSRGRRG